MLHFPTAYKNLGWSSECWLTCLKFDTNALVIWEQANDCSTVEGWWSVSERGFKQGMGPANSEFPYVMATYILIHAICLLLSLNLPRSLYTHWVSNPAYCSFKNTMIGKLMLFPGNHMQSPLHLSPCVASHHLLSSYFFPPLPLLLFVGINVSLPAFVQWVRGHKYALYFYLFLSILLRVHLFIVFLHGLSGSLPRKMKDSQIVMRVRSQFSVKLHLYCHMMHPQVEEELDRL